MTINELIQNLPVRLTSGDGNVAIRAVQEDSRHIEPGDLFVARAGTQAHGATYIEDAVRRGASALLAATVPPKVAAAAILSCDDPARHGAIIAERAAGTPSSRLAVVGVTGTNGKTTVAHLIQQLLNNSGRRCGLIGTVKIDDGVNVRSAELTTPAACDLSRYLAQTVEHGCSACVMETSSHALDQQRTAGLQFAGGVFTNLSGDHLDYHGTMEAYLAAKARLFESLEAGAWAVINGDDPWAEHIIARTEARVIRTSLDHSESEAKAVIHECTLACTRATLRGPWGAIERSLPLPGRHNVMNLLQALCAAHELGLSGDELSSRIEQLSAPPGRLEPVHRPGDGFAILVDYAHTDDALRNALSAVRPLVDDGGHLRVVFGCGGDRDRSKRPRMAAAACELADDVIVTSDNPRTEEPDRIIDDIMRGVPGRVRRAVQRLTDRGEAIHQAVARCEPGDILVIAGKGHEDYQIIGTRKRHFDDREVARAALASSGALV